MCVCDLICCEWSRMCVTSVCSGMVICNMWYELGVHCVCDWCVQEWLHVVCGISLCVHCVYEWCIMCGLCYVVECVHDLVCE